jgi:hypothetical protein
MPSTNKQPESDGRIQVTAGNMSDRVRHGQDRQSERKRYTQQSDTDARKFRGEYRATTATQYQPESPDQLRQKSFR